MSNYPAGAAAYLARQDAYEVAWDRCYDHHIDDVLLEIERAPEEFLSDWVNLPENDDIAPETVTRWAQERKFSRSRAEAVTGAAHHQILETQFQKKLDQVIETNVEFFR